MDLTGKNIVITGSLRPLTREEAIRFLESKGAVVQNYVSSRTDILVLGHKQLNLFDPDKGLKSMMQHLDEYQTVNPSLSFQKNHSLI